MTGPKILVTGAGGQLGRELALARPDATALARKVLDVTDRGDVHAAVAHHRPDVILHTAAMTAVDACEERPELALSANVLGTRLVVEAATKVSARVVLLSTDYVFGGNLARPLTESDPTDPQSWYGRSKLAAERELRDVDVIARTSWLAGAHGPNIVRSVLSRAASGVRLQFVDDQIGSPSFTFDVATSILELVDNEFSGLVHVANEGSVSWFDYIRLILAAGGYSPDQVEPVATADLDPPRAAPRPAFSALNTSLLAATGFFMPPPFQDSLPRLVSEISGKSAAKFASVALSSS